MSWTPATGGKAVDFDGHGLLGQIDEDTELGSLGDERPQEGDTRPIASTDKRTIAILN